MIGRASEKVQGGKLVKAEVEYGERIRRVKITGDFFIYPEEAIGALEKSIVGAPASSSEEELAEKVRNAAEESGALLIGITPEAVARVVKGAMK